MEICQGILPFNFGLDQIGFRQNFFGLGCYNSFLSLQKACLGLDQSGVGGFYLYLGLFKSGLSGKQSSLCITHGFNALAGLVLNTAYGEYTQY
jgi:hypothetical protein